MRLDVFADKPLIDELLQFYGLEPSDLPRYLSEWGTIPPMTRQEATDAIDALDAAQVAGLLPEDIYCDREVCRDVVLVRRGFDLMARYTDDERKKFVGSKYADGRRVLSDDADIDSVVNDGSDDVWCVRDLTPEIIRVAWEL